MQELRGYETPIGVLPSVTSILSLTQSEEKREKLRKWQHKMDKVSGKGAADRYSTEARNRGTLIHKLIHLSLMGQAVNTDEFDELLQVKPILQAIKPIAMELKVWHQSGYAGTLDCIATYQDKICLFDWKTSKRIKRRSWIQDYFLQGAAYAQAWNSLYPDQQANRVVIVVMGQQLQIFDEDLELLLPEWNERLQEYKKIGDISLQVVG